MSIASQEKERPLAVLMRLVAESASGELICAAPGLEVHVFLQRGRVAWCIESGKPFAFTRKLFEGTDLDRESFQQIIEECRRDRLPLGETLIAWGIASFEQVREALRHQIVYALESLSNQDAEAKILFLERSREFADYDETLTFDLEEILPSAGREEERGQAPAQRPAKDDLRALTEQMHAEIPGASWTEVWVDGKPPARRLAAAPPADAIAAVAGISLDDGADFLALRTKMGTVGGATFPDRAGYLWFGLRPDATLGAAFSALTSVLRLDERAPAPASAGGAKVCQEGRAADAPDALRFLEGAEDVLGVAVVEDGSEFRAYREDSDLSDAFDALHRRRPLLDKPELSRPLWPEETAAEPSRFDASLVVGEDDKWCFGARLAGNPPMTLWLIMCRSTTQGLGWAYLSALARQLGRRGT